MYKQNLQRYHREPYALIGHVRFCGGRCPVMGISTKGISKRSYPNLDIKNLTRDQAKEIYFRDFWLKGKYEQIEDENIAIKLFDLSVNMGIGQANKLVQRALLAVGVNVAEDGIIGSITLKAINEADPTDLLAALKSESAGHYRLIANLNPSQKRFIEGWLSRAYC
ncbi:MAG: hypothetical protein LBB25_01795 [Holosporaceae bacterium]|nr:hypothetical protein [Holosporaceae bacterium]